MSATKQNALKNLLAAGYAAEITKTGLAVHGEGWSVHYDDRGQDHNVYIGSIPARVEELAVWDDETTREEVFTTEPKTEAGNGRKKAEMEKRDYRVKHHKGFGFSIDEYSGGKYLCQVAYWFTTRAEARTRLAEIVAEDARAEA